MIIRQAELAGGPVVDVRIEAGRIREIAERISSGASEEVVNAGGAALLPGLIDHHIHLLSLAAAMDSLRCGPPQVRSRDQLRAALARPQGDGSHAHAAIRGIGYHESVAGPLDREELDRLGPRDRPVRIQHRSGALWIYNTAALARLRLEPGEALPPGAERDGEGHSNGRFHRLDDWLRERCGQSTAPDLAPVSELLAGYGVTGVCDATHGNGAEEIALFEQAIAAGKLRQEVRLMGTADLLANDASPIRVGAVKFMLDDHRLPPLDSLRLDFEAAHRQRRAVAIHCVTRAELILTLTALREAGCLEGDRIEHAGIAPPDALELMSALPISVVTQPNFIRERGDAYLRDVDARDLPWLDRARSFQTSGIPLAFGSDAPFGEADPWACMRAAVQRTSESGAVLGAQERLSPEAALAGFCTPLASPGRAPSPLAPSPTRSPRRAREIVSQALGCSADLCLLDRPWSQVRDRLDAEAVRLSLRQGEIIYARD